jgi:hypothetical protein
MVIVWGLYALHGYYKKNLAFWEEKHDYVLLTKENCMENFL